MRGLAERGVLVRAGNGARARGRAARDLRHAAAEPRASCASSGSCWHERHRRLRQHVLRPDRAARCASASRRVSLYVGWDGDLKPERDYTDLDAFYARLRESDALPQTSQPSVGDFLAVYEPLIARGDDIVSIHLAEGLSGTCQSAREAAKALDGGRVEVVDAETGAGGLA